MRLPAIFSIYSLNFLDLQPHIISLQKYVISFKKGRSIGIKYVIYLNDGLNGSSTYNNCKECTNYMNSQIFQWLGTLINTSTSLPKTTVDKLNTKNNKVLIYRRLIEVTFWKGQVRRFALALDIFKICIENDIKIIPTWIPREQEFFAHYYSNNFDTDDWSIEQNSFETIYKKWGTVTFDRFAKEK